MDRRILLKMCAALSFIFITFALILIYQNSPATGYELSLYNSLPAATWIFLIAAITLGTGIIVVETFSDAKSNFWYYGFLILIISNFIILSIHFIRGYFFLTISDPLAHMGFTANIVSSGSIGDNFYPITHILGTEIIEITSIELLTVIKYLPVIFTILSMIFIYLLASAVSLNKSHALLAAAAGSTLLFSYYHVSTYPQSLSLFTFPMGFYIYFKSTEKPSVAFKILLIILLLLFPVFHPAPEVVIIFCLVGGEAARVIWRKRMGLKSLAGDKFSSNPALISIIIFFTWLSSFAVLYTIANQSFLKWYRSNVAEIPRLTELQTVSELPPLDQVLLVLKMYGDQFIYLTLSMIALYIIYRYYIKRQHESKNLFILSVLLLISGPVYAMIFISTGMTTIGRLAGANTVLWITPVLAGFSLYEIFKNPGISRQIAIGLVASILVLASVLGIFTVYRSPWIYEPNEQITRMDMSGFGWVSNYGVQESKYAYLGWPEGYHPIKVSAHFGYPEFKTFGESFQQNMTIIMTKKFRLAADNPILTKGSVAPPGLSVVGFKSDDIERLEQDTSVDRLYVNGEFDVLSVKTKGRG